MSHVTYFQKHEKRIQDGIDAIRNRGYYTPYPELPKFYGEDGDARAKEFISSVMNTNFSELLQESGQATWVGEEISPYTQTGLGILYPQSDAETLIHRSVQAKVSWSALSPAERAGILIEALERIQSRFFDITYATMHTTGQSYMMSFQASGPHSNDRALEAVITGYSALTQYPSEADWIKPMGKFELKIHKTWIPVPKGTGLVIGCSTFPIWNTVPGLFANLITGNPSIVKPHPKAILPIAIVVAEIQKLLQELNLDVHLVQLAPDTLAAPVTKTLAEHPSVSLIDFTGSSEFGSYVESLPKTVFTEKAGVNSVILDSVNDMKAVVSNIAFSASLYSGQMCTAPQNIFVSASGVASAEGNIPFDEVVKQLAQGITDLVQNPKAGPPTLGAIQTDATKNRLREVAASASAKVVLESASIRNEEFPDARTASPLLMVLDKSDVSLYNRECFGPVLFVIKTDNLNDSVALARKLAETKGALTCSAYTTNDKNKAFIASEMNAAFTPVSFNFTGAAFINSHAAFSDLHVTGGNPAGNASLTNSEFVSRRFVWVGNRYA